MKRIVCLFFITLVALLAVSCGESVGTPLSDATITMTDLNGEKVDIHVAEDTVKYWVEN